MSNVFNQQLQPSWPACIFLMGPTASGKTNLALALSKYYPVEVISVDSALIYRDMNIGTAKPDADFLAELPHFLVDICAPDAIYSAANFRQDALEKIEQIIARGNIPLLVGGTMLYFKILFEGIADIPEADNSVRATILAEASAKGWSVLHEELAQVDPVSAKRIHPNHSQRIQRALEVFRSTGRALSEYHAAQAERAFPHSVLQFALDGDRSLLHQRINQRFQLMLDQGLIDEVQQLRERYDLQADMPSMRAVGYRQTWQYLDGEINRDELYEAGCAATRQLAKRQLTWLRKWPNLNKLSFEQFFEDETSILDQIHIQMNNFRLTS